MIVMFWREADLICTVLQVWGCLAMQTDLARVWTCVSNTYVKQVKIICGLSLLPYPFKTAA